LVSLRKFPRHFFPSDANIMPGARHDRTSIAPAPHNRVRGVCIALPASAVCADPALAHSFGTIYNLPVPFWMYAYGASAALVVSFLIVAYFASVPRAAAEAASPPAAGRIVGHLGGAWLAALRLVAVFLLLLAIVTGLFGSRNLYTNINMTLFWIVFVLGCFYVAAMIGDLYQVANPWMALCRAVERLSPNAFRPRLRYPARLGYYPAFALYVAFIWIELFGHTQPRSLAIVLIAYTVINFAGAALVGKERWFRYGEFFAVMFMLAGRIAPVEYAAADPSGRRYAIRLRKPFVGLLREPAEHVSLLLFVLFMLSSTAFDGVHQTLPWVTIFWKDIYPVLAALIARPYLFFVDFYYYWQWAMLILSPFFYLAIYVLFIWLTKIAAGSRLSLRELALRFTLSLVPIAFVYNVTHYYTLLASQGVSIVRMVSDPFGFGWDLFGTTKLVSGPLILDAGGVWHTQVALILLGHIAGVYLAHMEALRTFVENRRALLSQLPMLILMVLFTTAGLWILSLPIAAGQVVQPPTTPATTPSPAVPPAAPPR
jgi:hypothetical protein